MNARDAYSRLRHDLAPVGATTMGPCAKGCGEGARGSVVCRNCLVAELQVAVPTVDWPAFVATVEVSKNAIIAAEMAIEKVGRG